MAQPSAPGRRQREGHPVDASLPAAISRALSPFECLLSPAALSQIRQVLDEQIQRDPVLRVLIDAASNERER
jgi:hypothetical protein